MSKQASCSISGMKVNLMSTFATGTVQFFNEMQNPILIRVTEKTIIVTQLAQPARIPLGNREWIELHYLVLQIS
jgi:hypothetical protein